MPGQVKTTRDPAARKKRKISATTEKEPATKKTQTVSVVEPTRNADIVKNIEKLQKGVLESEKNYNSIVTLVEHVQSRNSKLVQTKAAKALRQIFTTLMSTGRLSRSKKDSPDQVTVIEWLRGRYNELTTELMKWLHDDEEAVRTLALEMLLEFVIAEASFLRPSKDEYWFPESLYRSMIKSLLKSENTNRRLLEEFCKNYVDKYGDLTYFTYTSITQICTSEEKKAHAWVQNVVTLLECMDGYPVSETITSPPLSIIANMPELKKAPAPLKATSLRRAYQECWIAALRSVIDPEELKTILREKTHLMIKHFMTPELLMDFFTGCYDRGGPLALLALDGLFQLIEKRNLDYPDFYKKLYAMFDRNLLHLKYRAQFFRLVDVFLSSSHLPATITASFIKRMSRLSLSAPPAAIVTIVPFVYNLLRKHPTCLFMLHRANQYNLNDLRKYGMEDPFLPDEEEPLNTEALESCLWELVMLRDHYNPNVARFCGILAEQFTKPTFNTEEFLEHSYASMIQEDLKKPTKKPVPIEFDVARVLTGPYKKKSEIAVAEVTEAEEDKEDDLWTFVH